jgi:hypothetical protein
MSDSITTKKLTIFATIKEGISIGIRNIVPIFVNVLLWVLTIWIPYLNVGTTIGLWVGIVSKASKGNAIPMTEIFDPKYRKYMGEFFITSGLIGIGVGAGFVFLIIPAIVIGIAWSLAQLLVIDKGKNPTEAITLSNNYTYGNKGRIFCIYFLVFLASGIISFILLKIPKLGIILVSAVNVLMLFVSVGLQASIYKQLTGAKAEIEGIKTENAAAPAVSAPVPATAGGMFCPACGMKNSTGTKFCGACGAQIS